MRARVAFVALALLAGGGEIESPLPNCDEIHDDAGYEACVAYVGERLMQQQQQIAQEPEFATPNQPTTIILDQGGSGIAEWAALLTGIAALLGVFEAFRRRRHHQP